jgi:hypothetical protein
MRVGETITFTREVLGSAGCGVYPVYLKNLALVSTTTDPLTPEHIGAPVTRHWTFLAVKSGMAEIQFVKLRPGEPSKAIYEEILPIDVKPADGSSTMFEKAVRVGAWSPFEKAKDDDPDFKDAFDGLLGVGYTPLLVTTQLVNGKNYIFLANADVTSPESVPYSVLVRVYKGHDVKARIVNFTSLGNPSSRFTGGYAPFREIGVNEDDIPQKVVDCLDGLSFKAEYVSTQVVAGIRYRFAGTVTLDEKGENKYPALLTVYMPPSGDPTITGIEKVCNLV